MTVAAAFVCAAMVGCGPVEPQTLVAPYPQPRSVVVMPLLNQSPTSEFDVIAATDAMVDELMRVGDLVVYPTNQALKLLLERGHTHAASMTEAIEVARMLGADGVVVGAVNDYNPYPPQKISMTLQIHWLRADMGYGGDDPVMLSRSPSVRPMQGPVDIGHGSQVQEVFDAASDETVKRVRMFAQLRNGQDSPYGWRRFMVDSEAYMHFACREMIMRLMIAELDRITLPVAINRNGSAH